MSGRVDHPRLEAKNREDGTLSLISPENLLNRDGLGSVSLTKYQDQGPVKIPIPIFIQIKESLPNLSRPML